MFGSYFYNQRIRKSVALFGRLFNNIYIMRTVSNGDGNSTVKVPLSYAPKRKYMERLLENPDLDTDAKVAIKLPRMSFEITSIAYDSTRQLSKVNNVNYAGSSITNRSKLYSPTPYNVGFQLNIYAKSQDDALQVVEQILPFFSPSYNITIKPLDNFSTLKEDVPIVLNGVSFSDDFEGAMEQRRTIIYTLDFEMKINFYGPSKNEDIIRQVDINLGLMNAGLNDSDVITERIRVVPDPIGANPDSDFGFTTTITFLIDSA